MTDKEKIKAIFYRLIGYVYIPKGLRGNKQNTLLHISDTPEIFFPALKKIIKELQPEYIIHTGDLVDNIKLEIYPGSISRYEKRLKILLDILEESNAKEIFLCVGNHDNREVIEKLVGRSRIIGSVEKININGFTFTMSHFSRKILKVPSDYNLFGHNLRMGNIKEENKIYLNGIISINIVNLDTGEIYNLPYPFGTDENRMGRGKAGF